jgi:RNA polymerase sigma-70 factor (ECF subfamily)
MAIRTMLERLTTDELVAYVLRQAFAYPYARIAILAGTSETNARQLVSRAGRRLRVAGPRRRIRPLDERRLAAALVAAARSGNVSGLEELLTSQLRPAPRGQVGQEAAA